MGLETITKILTVSNSTNWEYKGLRRKGLEPSTAKIAIEFTAQPVNPQTEPSHICINIIFKV